MKNSTFLLIALLVTLSGSLLFNLVLLSLVSSSENETTKYSKPYLEALVQPGTGKKQKKIVVIPLEGVIGYRQPNPLGDNMVTDVQAALRQADLDPDAIGVILSVNSPGGEVTASDVLYQSIKTFNPEKPVLVYFNAIGASGAFYLACGGDWMMCSPTTLTGSIGVIISTLNYRSFFGKLGLESLVFKSGKFKDMLNGGREISPEEKAYIQSLVMQSYDRFLGIVAQARKLNPDSLRNGPADGRILSGTNAKDENLIDQLGYLEDAYTKARELVQNPNAKIVQYQREVHLGDLLGALTSSASASEQKTLHIQLPGTESLGGGSHPYSLQPGQLYLLPPFLAP